MFPAIPGSGSAAIAVLGTDGLEQGGERIQQGPALMLRISSNQMMHRTGRSACLTEGSEVVGWHERHRPQSDRRERTGRADGPVIPPSEGPMSSTREGPYNAQKSPAGGHLECVPPTELFCFIANERNAAGTRK